MPHASSFKLATLAFFAILSFGCNKNHDETRANATSAADSAVVADFSTLDAKAWVNGSPVSLDGARGKHVVLIEAWHPA
jgi:hypothetical protein